MPVRDILQLGNEILWERSAPVSEVGSDEIVTTITDLSDTLADFRHRRGFGRGIAAPQLGVLKRVIYVRTESAGFDGPLINPEITWRSCGQMEVWDCCFSFPSLMVRLVRAREIHVKYLASTGEERQLKAYGDFSELLQHEIDHLDGILACDRALSARDFVTRDEWLRQRRFRT
ncbi:formylmethionine deformylase [candidate division GN15 bacterium]|uniref:Peptide deformylase n=1 Tax=candidate division GN15 bacterium TaxID=2072418 RepID=A0A855X5J9_9BACT|nr:MAG: formylmethionine deformylase [candidate division GN15 bacterium]